MHIKSNILYKCNLLTYNNTTYNCLIHFSYSSNSPIKEKKNQFLKKKYQLISEFVLKIK